ncbi:class 3 adenylate cyclase/pimeloyl-ACP methyl ester carboxylesterase [Mycobacterium sp. OAS707]|uniref:adenylate/guanylate cyclase domain-containing protein n=1 Tax=Mycobacterium sp. OAS707 TaxID=2663822 RepID=UPI00178BDF31|nr:adenylate/guanylate cyclase domain-containing protein [Mycobacterium sp. OAS707]MBE1550404.1 class 3 adenylate cyclase/pimeloyl-ACP methyl ester carboxylesterase [Mycobacterium sp. OAS707]
MAPLPQTQYAKGPGGDLAYQIVGDGPIDLVIVPGWFSHVDLLWADPGWKAFLDDLASFARVILYDKLGTGLSDPIDRPPTLEDEVADLRAVLDAAESEHTALFGYSEGGPISVLFAGTYPERVRALVMFGSYACGWPEEDDSPARAKWLELKRLARDSLDHWGEGRTVDWAAPSRKGSALYRRAVGAYERAGMSPKMARLVFESILIHIDIRDILGSVRVPTLVLHRTGDAIPVEYGRELAEKIPNARFIELDGVDHWPGAGDIKSITGATEEFLTGHRHQTPADRVLATVMFTDIVDSTRRAAELGDRSWRELLGRHDEMTREEIARFQGREIKHTGDGFLATFDGPTRAVRCATTLNERIAGLGIDIRTGLHTGECEVRGDDIGGIAVHIGARIAALADRQEVLVSSTVKDLVNGSGITFEERGTHALKGIPARWQLYAPVGERDPAEIDQAVATQPRRDLLADQLGRQPRIARTVLRLARRR